MLNKIERPKKLNRIDEIKPMTIDEIVRKDSKDISKIYDYLDYLVDYINKKEE